jgi:hypothetical protein
LENLCKFHRPDGGPMDTPITSDYDKRPQWRAEAETVLRDGGTVTRWDFESWRETAVPE